MKQMYARLRPEVRADTFSRDGNRCRCPCQRLLYLNSDDPWQHANIHETEEPRWECAVDVSLRRTITLTKECHEQVERNRLKIEYGDPQLKCNGPVYFTGRLANGSRVVRYESHPAIDFDDFRRNRAASNLVIEAARIQEDH